MNLLLFIIAWVLIPPLTVWNLIVVNRKYGNTKGYFRSTALSIDIWANKGKTINEIYKLYNNGKSYFSNNSKDSILIN